ncbi:hypothetical protein ARMGADRAFT_1169833 [Armillaria gallica]|uniref:Uncharacterized protein n=1 Tax=Armillaria gallica TaxID=47427 RepID=A0A2H3D0C1_ARMGA|nr:hypothetical protein ARMGADRAFT_1169833 [Armillaria gallica]
MYNISGSQERFSNVDLRRNVINDLPSELLREISSIVVSTDEEDEGGSSKARQSIQTVFGVAITDFSPDHPMCYPAKVGSSPQSTAFRWQQIASLQLSNVSFEVREDYITSQDVLDGNFNAEEGLPIPLRFIRKLTTFKQLSEFSTLREDDEITRDDLARLINFSTVETMDIEEDNWEIQDWDPALTFLHNRFQSPSAQDGIYHGVVMNRLNMMLLYKLSDLAEDFDLEWMLDDDDIDKGGNVSFGLCLDDMTEDEASHHLLV